MEKKIKGFPGKDWRNDLAKKVLKHISPPKSVKEKNNYFVSGSTIISIPKKK